MKCLAVLLCALAAVGAVSFYDLVKEEWEAFKMQHDKKYASEVEDKFRMKIFAENKHKIAKHNQRFQRGLEPFSLQQNKYGDMLPHEFVHTMNGFNKTLKNETNRTSRMPEPTRRFLFYILKKKHELIKRFLQKTAYIIFGVTTEPPPTTTPDYETSEESEESETREEEKTKRYVSPPPRHRQREDDGGPYGYPQYEDKAYRPSNKNRNDNMHNHYKKNNRRPDPRHRNQGKRQLLPSKAKLPSASTARPRARPVPAH